MPDADAEPSVVLPVPVEAPPPVLAPPPEAPQELAPVPVLAPAPVLAPISQKETDSKPSKRCHCRGQGPNYDCRTQFTPEENAMFAKIRASNRTTKRGFMHAYAVVNCKRGGENTTAPAKKDADKNPPRIIKTRQRMEYRLCHRRVCKPAFMELQGIGGTMIKNAQKKTRAGIVVPVKTKRANPNHILAVKAEEFLQKYAEDRGIEQPGNVGSILHCCARQ